MVSFASHLNNDVLTQRLVLIWGRGGIVTARRPMEVWNNEHQWHLQGRSCQNPWAHSSLSTWAEELWNSSTCESGAHREDGSGLEQLYTNKHSLSFFHLLALSRSLSLSVCLSLMETHFWLHSTTDTNVILTLFLLIVTISHNCGIIAHNLFTMRIYIFLMNRSWAIATLYITIVTVYQTILIFLHNCRLISHKCDLISHKCKYFHSCDFFSHNCDFICHSCNFLSCYCNVIFYNCVIIFHNCNFIYYIWEFIWQNMQLLQLPFYCVSQFQLFSKLQVYVWQMQPHISQLWLYISQFEPFYPSFDFITLATLSHSDFRSHNCNFLLQPFFRAVTLFFRICNFKYYNWYFMHRHFMLILLLPLPLQLLYSCNFISHNCIF